MNQPQTAPQAGRVAVLLALLSAVGFSFHTTFASWSYDFGMDVATLLFLRGTITVLALYALMKVLGIDPWLKGRSLAGSFALGLLLSLQAFTMLTALIFIKASLMILVFYLSPLMVSVMSHFAGMHRMSVINFAALLLALSGVALALGVAPEGVDWRGVALAFASAVAVSINIVGSALVMRNADSIAVTFTMGLAMLLVFAAVMVGQGTFSIPNADLGWLPVIVSVVAYPIAAVSLYVAIRRAGPAPIAMLLNVEPIATIGIAALVLGERLTELQFVGAALVIIAVFASRFVELRAGRRTAGG